MGSRCVEEGNGGNAERGGVVLGGGHEVGEGGVDAGFELVKVLLVRGGEVG